MPSIEMFNAKGQFLSQEGYLLHSCLATGAMDLQDASLSNKGKFYSAFFLLSIGMERLMKVIIIIEYMARNDLDTPKEKEIKGYNHDLVMLFDACKRIASDYDVKDFDNLEEQPLSLEIVRFLSDFSKGARYHNLDSLSRESNDKIDPLARWRRLLDQVLRADGLEDDLYATKSQGEELGTLLESSLFSLWTDLNGNSPPIGELYSDELHIQLATPFVLARIFTILGSLYELVRHIVDLAHGIELTQRNPLMTVPFMYEFVEFARWPDPEMWRFVPREDT